MFGSASKAFFHLLAQSRTLKKLATRFAMRTPASFVRRFVPGETVEDAIRAARALEAHGLTETFDHLGESVTTLAGGGRRDHATIWASSRAIIEAGVERNISLKLTQLGLDVDRASAVDNLRKILELAEPAGFFVRIDMESSRYTAVTLEIFETLWQQGYRQIGVVLQSDLYRSEERSPADQRARGAHPPGQGRVPRAEVGGVSEEGRRRRGVRADDESADHRRPLSGDRHARSRHDRTRPALGAEHGVAPDRFEFQMLYGIRRDLQAMLVDSGYRVRVYMPFGRDWFPYFMRRLGEHPANVAFVLRGIVGEHG